MSVLYLYNQFALLPGPTYVRQAGFDLHAHEVIAAPTAKVEATKPGKPARSGSVLSRHSLGGGSTPSKTSKKKKSSSLLSADFSGELESTTRRIEGAPVRSRGRKG